jgi:hypothetical protein
VLETVEGRDGTERYKEAYSSSMGLNNGVKHHAKINRGFGPVDTKLIVLMQRTESNATWRRSSRLIGRIAATAMIQQQYPGRFTRS